MILGRDQEWVAFNSKQSSRRTEHRDAFGALRQSTAPTELSTKPSAFDHPKIVRFSLCRLTHGCVESGVAALAPPPLFNSPWSWEGEMAIIPEFEKRGRLGDFGR
jgi:hypothetical protein